MASKLEKVLLRYSDNGKSPVAIRDSLFRHLDAQSLRSLRIASRHIRDLVDARVGQCFRDLYINAPLRLPQTTHEMAFLHAILPTCYSLTIITKKDHSEPGSAAISRSSSRSTLMAIYKKLGCTSNNGSTSGRLTARASMLDTLMAKDKKDQLFVDRRRWTRIFEACRQLRHLTLRIYGDPGWPGCTDLESQLIRIRCALEEATMSTTPELHLTPVHAMGLVHFRWSSFGAFGLPLSLHRAAPLLWHGLSHLDIQLRNPFVEDRLNEAQVRQFKQLFYGYLRSFAPTLQRLTFVYLDEEGPSSMTLHLQPELCHKAPLIWGELVELRLGNISLPYETIETIPSLCPKLETVKLLRSQYRYSYGNAAREEDMWLDVRLRRNPLVVINRASSIYSQPEFDVAYLGGVSRTSREVPFVLDLRYGKGKQRARRSGIGLQI